MRERKLNATQEIVKIILQRGNGPGLITEWFDGMRAWAEANDGQDAAALRIWLNIAKPRPFYTSDELALLWPALKLTLGLATRLDAPPGANRLHNELWFHRLPVVFNGNPGNANWPFFEIEGKTTQYFIVEHCHKWRDRPLTTEQLLAVLAGEEIE